MRLGFADSDSAGAFSAAFFALMSPLIEPRKAKKGGKKGSGKGKKTKQAFADLPEERKEEIRAKHAEKQSELGREQQGNTFFFGELVQRRKSYGWVKPANFGKLPSEVQTKVKEMVRAKRKIVKETGGGHLDNEDVDTTDDEGSEDYTDEGSSENGLN